MLACSHMRMQLRNDPYTRFDFHTVCACMLCMLCLNTRLRAWAQEEETHRRRSQRKAARRAQDRLASLGEDGADFDAWPRSHQHSFSAPLAARRLAQYSWLQVQSNWPTALPCC